MTITDAWHWFRGPDDGDTAKDELYFGRCSGDFLSGQRSCDVTPPAGEPQHRPLPPPITKSPLQGQT